MLPSPVMVKNPSLALSRFISHIPIPVSRCLPACPPSLRCNFPFRFTSLPSLRLSPPLSVLGCFFVFFPLPSSPLPCPPWLRAVLSIQRRAVWGTGQKRDGRRGWEKTKNRLGKGPSKVKNECVRTEVFISYTVSFNHVAMRKCWMFFLGWRLCINSFLPSRLHCTLQQAFYSILLDCDSSGDLTVPNRYVLRLTKGEATPDAVSTPQRLIKGFWTHTGHISDKSTDQRDDCKTSNCKNNESKRRWSGILTWRSTCLLCQSFRTLHGAHLHISAGTR